MRNSENSSARSKFAAVTRIGLLVLIFAVVFATVLSCGVFGENTSLNGSVENVAEAYIAGGNTTALSSYPNFGLSIADVQNALHTSGTYTVSCNLSSVGFEPYTSFHRTGDMGDGTSVGQGRVGFSSNGSIDYLDNPSHTAGGWGVKTESSRWRQPGIVAALNIQIPSTLSTFLSLGYNIKVKYQATVYTADYTTDTGYGMTASGSVRHASSYVSGDDIGSSQSGGSWSSTKYNNGQSLDFGTITLSSGQSFLNIFLAKRSSGANQSLGIWVSGGGTLTFTVTKGSASDATAPTYSYVSSEGDGFNGLVVPQDSDSSINNAYQSAKGQSSTPDDNYTFGMVTGRTFASVEGFTYYKSVKFNFKDGDVNNAAFYNGVYSATLSKGGASAIATAGTAQSSGTAFRVEMSSSRNAGTEADVTVYFAESGTYTLTFTDNGAAYNSSANTKRITITIEGIDTTVPVAGGTAPSGGASDIGNLGSASWLSLGALQATLNGMDSAVNLTDGNSAWVYYFDVKYSFFPFISAPSADTSAITNGTAYPFAVNSTTNKVYFSYNTTTGAVQSRVGDTGNMTGLNKAAPLSGTKEYGKAGYYAFIIYVADMAGNLCSSPFVYYVKVDNQSVSGVSTKYQYDTDGTGTAKQDASGWINQYMVGTDGKVYVDISFKLNPSGNIVTFNYGGNYYGSAPIADSYNFTATVTPKAAGEVSVSVTGNGDVNVNGITTLVEGLTTDELPRAMLQINVGTPQGSGADWTVTLTLIYSRGGTAEDKGEFSISNSNAIGVAAGCGGSATSATVDVKIDTQSISDFDFAENGGYVSKGTYSEENGGITIDTSTVVGRKWYTTNGALSLTSNTNVYTINEYLLNTSENSNYATYFGWKVYTNGKTVNDDIKAGLASFKSEVAGAGTGMADAFETFFGMSGDDNMWQVVKPSASGSLLSGQTPVNVYIGGAGVRVLYIMTLDQAGNANFSVYYLFVDPTSYEMTFEIPADYIGKFPALGNVTFEASDFVSNEVTLTFKRGQNIAVTVNGLPTGYVPYTVSKVIGEQVVKFYDQNLINPRETSYGIGGFIEGKITCPDGDFASGSTIAFVLDQAENLGMIGSTGSDIGLRFTFRKNVELTTVTNIEYNGYKVTEKTHVINATSGAADFSPQDIAAVREAAYGMIKWSGDGLVYGLPINAGSYKTTQGVNFREQPYYISNDIVEISLNITKRTVNLSGSLGDWSDGTYGDIKKAAFDALTDSAFGALSVTAVAGVADLGQDNGKTLADIISGSGYINVNGNAVGSEAYNALFSQAGNLNAGSYAFAFNSACTADNYTFTAGKSFNVAKRAIEVSVSGGKTYGSPDGDITLGVPETGALYGDSMDVVFPDLPVSGLYVTLGAGSASARNYVYENQGTTNYTNAGEYAFTALNVPGANLSKNFTLVIKEGSVFVVSPLDVYIIPDSGQTITTLEGYNITYKYFDKQSGGKQITDSTIVPQIKAGSFVVDGEFTSGVTVYNIKVGTEFSLVDPENANLVLHTVIDGITVTLDYDWSKTVITVTFAADKAPVATYKVNFNNTLLNYDESVFSFSYSVGGAAATPGLPEGFTISWTGGKLVGYDANTATAGQTFAVELEGISLMNGDNPADDTYSVVVSANVSVDYLHVTLTPEFDGTTKVYGAEDSWSYSVKPSVAGGLTLVDDGFLSGLTFDGELGRALYNAGGFVRAGRFDDCVNALLGEGEYYAAYTVSSYTCNDSSVRVDEIATEALKAILFDIEPLNITIDNVTATGMNKPVPTGDANVPYTDNPFKIGNMIAGDDVYIAYTSAVYVKKAVEGVRPEFTENELKGLDGDIGDLDIQISGLKLAGADAANYVLSGDIAGEGYIFEIVGEGGDFKIFAYKFSGITSGDVIVNKVYDATPTLTEDNFTIMGVLKTISDTFDSFTILGRRYGKYDYKMQLLTDDAGTYSVETAFFVEGLSAISFEVPGENSDFAVGDWNYNGKDGVVIVVYRTVATIAKYALGIDEVKISASYTERYYNGTSVVGFTFAWADGADTSIFTNAELTNLRLRANFTLNGKDAATYTGINVSGFTYNASSNFAPSFSDAEIAAALSGIEPTIKPIPIEVSFAFVAKEYGSATTELDGSYSKTIASEYRFDGWEDELGNITIVAGDATFTYWQGSLAEGSAYPYVQYDESGNVRLHDIKYENVTFSASEGVVLGNYTFAGNALSAGSEGVIEAVAELNPKTLVFNTGYFLDVTKQYDGTKDANATLRDKIKDINAVFNNGLVGDDGNSLDIDFSASFDNLNAGDGRNITMSGIALVAKDEANAHIAKSYALTNSSVTIQGCTITKAPLTVVFTLPTKQYDGTVFVDSVSGAVYYELSGFAVDGDKNAYVVTFLAAGYNDVNAGDSVGGIFIGVQLAARNGSNPNYYLVDAEGKELVTKRYDEVSENRDGVVARYATAGKYTYLEESATGTAYTVISAFGKIEKRVYEVTVEGTISKQFDNTDVFSDTGSLTLKVEDEGIDLSGITITGVKFATVNVGNDITVVITLSYTGDNPNYTINETATAKGSITARTLTVSVSDGADFVYGFGGNEPDYSSALVYTLTIGEAAYDVAVIGGKAYMTEEGYKALAGADAVLPVDTTTVGDVTYYALNGNVGAVTLNSDAFKKVNGKWADAGSYAVKSVSGVADNFVFALAADQNVEIKQAQLTVSAKGDYEYVIDTAIADLEALVLRELVYSGITNGDTVAAAVSGITVSFGDLVGDATPAPASEFAITLGTANVVSKNYTVSVGESNKVIVRLPALSVSAKSGQSSVYDGANKLDDVNFLADLVNYVTAGVEKEYSFEVVGDIAEVKNAGSYTIAIKVTCKYTGLDGYAADNGAYVTTATVSVAYDVNKATLNISRSGKVSTIYFNAAEQKLTDYAEFFAFEGAVAGEEQAMLKALATSARYNGKETFRNAGAYDVALNAADGVFANYNVTSAVTLLNVKKAPVNVNGTVSEGDIGSDVAFGVTVTGIVPAAGCPVDAATVGKLRTTVSYTSGAVSVAQISEAGVYNYVITLSDSNYEIVSGGTLGASGTVTVTVKVVTETDESADKKAEVVFDTPQTKNWVLTSYEMAESNSTYISYSNAVSQLAVAGQTVEIGGVVRLELSSGTTTINATTTGKLGETVEISVKLPSALSSGTSGYVIYERQKDGSLKEITDYVVTDGYFTYNSDLISDLVFVRIVGSGVPFWIWILVAVLAALIILAIILAAFIGRKDRSNTPPAAPPAEPTVEEEAPVSHDGALPAADVDIDIPDAPAHIGGGDRPPLIGNR